MACLKPPLCRQSAVGDLLLRKLQTRCGPRTLPREKCRRSGYSLYCFSREPRQVHQLPVRLNVQIASEHLHRFNCIRRQDWKLPQIFWIPSWFDWTLWLPWCQLRYRITLNEYHLYRQKSALHRCVTITVTFTAQHIARYRTNSFCGIRIVCIPGLFPPLPFNLTGMTVRDVA